MAVWQFYLAVFPKEGILRGKGEIPDKLIKNDFTGFFEKEPDKFWEESNIESKDIILYIDKILPRASWGNKDEFYNNWKLEDEFVDNDLWISLNKEKTIEEFYLRFDLRQPKLKFLMQIIDLSKKYNFLISDYEGNLIDPKNISDLKTMILKNPRANSFIKDKDFFNSL